MNNNIENNTSSQTSGENKETVKTAAEKLEKREEKLKKKNLKIFNRNLKKFIDELNLTFPELTVSLEEHFPTILCYDDRNHTIYINYCGNKISVILYFNVKVFVTLLISCDVRAKCTKVLYT